MPKERMDNERRGDEKRKEESKAVQGDGDKRRQYSIVEWSAVE